MCSKKRASHAKGWIEKLIILAACSAYACAFWGQAAIFLPFPLDEWHSITYRLLHHWWHRHAPSFLTGPEQIALFQAVEAYILALLLPVYLLRRYGCFPHQMGLRRPDKQGWLLGAIGVLLTSPAGFWLSRVVPNPWGTLAQELLGFISTVPEHFLIFGVFAVLLLPEHQLAWPATRSPQYRHAVFALFATAGVFALIHIGACWQELLASFPLGLVFAYLTLRTASIWPALVAHWVLNLLPMSWYGLRGGP